MKQLCFKNIKYGSSNEGIVVFEHDKFEQPIVILDVYAITKIMSKLKHNTKLLDEVNSMYSDITIEFKE